MAQPVDVPRWATAQTDPDAAITEPTSGQKDDGYLTGAAPSAAGFNWLLNVIYQWVLYLQAQVFTGSVDVTGALTAGTMASDGSVVATTQVSGANVLTAEADIRHGDRVENATDFFADYLGGNWTLSNGTFQCAASVVDGAEVKLRLPVGVRIKSVRVQCRTASSIVGGVSAQLKKSVATAGAASPTVTTPVAAVNTTATANIQTLTLTPATTVVAADEEWFVSIAVSNSLGVKNVYRIEYTFDRISS